MSKYPIPDIKDPEAREQIEVMHKSEFKSKEGEFTINKKDCHCPILNKEIDGMECFDAALVFEEISPVSKLPDRMQFTKENQSICLKCKYHAE